MNRFDDDVERIHRVMEPDCPFDRDTSCGLFQTIQRTLSCQWDLDLVPRRDSGRLHQPVLASKYGNVLWGSYCDACSADEDDYVSPCRVVPAKDWPPLTLVDPDLLSVTPQTSTGGAA